MIKLSIIAALLLQGCAASTLVDIGVMAETGKNTGSHALSKIHNQDCNTMRLLKGNEVCQKVYYEQSYYKR